MALEAQMEQLQHQVQTAQMGLEQPALAPAPEPQIEIPEELVAEATQEALNREQRRQEQEKIAPNADYLSPPRSTEEYLREEISKFVADSTGIDGAAQFFKTATEEFDSIVTSSVGRQKAAAAMANVLVELRETQVRENQMKPQIAELIVQRTMASNGEVYSKEIFDAYKQDRLQHLTEDEYDGMLRSMEPAKAAKAILSFHAKSKANYTNYLKANANRFTPSPTPRPNYSHVESPTVKYLRTILKV